MTERDVLRRCLGKGMSTSATTAGSIASSPLITIGPDANMKEAMDLMASKDIRRLFVVDKGKIVGRVTQTELFQSTLSVMEILVVSDDPTLESGFTGGPWVGCESTYVGSNALSEGAGRIARA